MAKNKKEKFNYKNVKINEEELSITKIGEMENAEQSPFLIFLLFGIILAFVFFLPTIVNFIKGPDEKLDYSLINNKTNEEVKENTDSETAESAYYLVQDSLVINLEEGIGIAKFSLNGNEFSFEVTNSRGSRFYFNKDNYFLELYSEDNTLLERFLLSDKVVASNATETFHYTVSSNTALNMKKVTFVKKAIADYPNVVLEKNNNQEEILVCSNANENLTYKFQNEKLISIADVVNYSANSVDYATNLAKWQAESEKLNAMNGIQSLFVNAGNGFVVNTSLDLKNVNLSNVDNVHYYAYETLAKVVSFEMNARGFRCK